MTTSTTLTQQTQAVSRLEPLLPSPDSTLVTHGLLVMLKVNVA